MALYVFISIHSKIKENYHREEIVQTCSKCHHISPDSEKFCLNCGADLSEFSETSIARVKLLNNPRVTAIRISVAKDCCPTCLQMEGVYAKHALPHLPTEGCSHPKGCRCHYAPILDEIYP